MVKLVAHKCGYCEAQKPENSLDALKYSLDKDYIDGIELDIQLTKDNQLVVIHDKKINKLSNGKGLIRKKTLNELKELDFNGSKLITLEEVLNLVPENKHIFIEIKRPVFQSKKIMDHYYNLIKKYKDKQIVTICFISDVLRYLKLKDLNLKTGVLVDIKTIYNVFDNSVDYVFLKKDIASKSLVSFIIKRSKKVGFFTINTFEEFDKIRNKFNFENMNVYITTSKPFSIFNRLNQN